MNFPFCCYCCCSSIFFRFIAYKSTTNLTADSIYNLSLSVKTPCIHERQGKQNNTNQFGEQHTYTDIYILRNATTVIGYVDQCLNHHYFKLNSFISMRLEGNICWNRFVWSIILILAPKLPIIKLIYRLFQIILHIVGTEVLQGSSSPSFEKKPCLN